MINIVEKSKCCGCNACVQRCPKQCIMMNEDEEGFFYPKVDVFTCIDCGSCEKVCPVLNIKEERNPLEVYATFNRDERIRMQSSSGGVFTLFAKQIIQEGGVVFGARFNEDWDVIHDYTETIEGISVFRGSKYVQSRIGNMFDQAKQFLEQGRKVLFSGTPCQISGLKLYLQKKYDNLLTMDIVCHGVPSPLVWRNYLETVDISQVEDINFRAKQTEGFTWRRYGCVIKGKGAQNMVSQSVSENNYLRGYSKNLYLRPSCYHCPVKSGKSCSDITLGDYWGIWNKHPELDDNKGISMVLVNTYKGQKKFSSLNLEQKVSSYVDAIKNNPMLCDSPLEPVERVLFWNRFKFEGISCVSSFIQMMKPSLFLRIISRVKLIINKFG